MLSTNLYKVGRKVLYIMLLAAAKDHIIETEEPTAERFD